MAVRSNLNALGRARLRVGMVVGLLVLATGFGGFGCASRRDAKARETAPELTLSSRVEGSLHCGRGRCRETYRLVVDKRRKVRVTAEAPADPALPDFALVLEDANQRLIAENRVALERPRKIVATLAPGLYYVVLTGTHNKDDQLSYKLKIDPIATKSVTRKKRRSPSGGGGTPPPPPPPKRKVTVPSEVLEVERAGGEPVAVLLEAGTSQGIAPGQRGELVEGGQVIGRIEVVDVYAAGSRAKIVGGLTSPITLDTSAQIEK